MSATRENTVCLESGSVKYDLSQAAVPIAELIEMLNDAAAEGAEYVVGLSGNHRGAKWSSLNSSCGYLLPADEV